MRSQLGMTMVLSALGAVAVCACSSSSGSTPPAEAGSNACTSSLVNLFNNTSALCPIGAGGPETYDESITMDCDALKLKKGDVQYGQCFDYLVWEVDMDGSGNNLSKCFYDTASHQLVGVIFGDGTQDQCGGSSFLVQAGQVDNSCTVTGFQSGGGGLQQCSPTSDAGSSSGSSSGGSDAASAGD